MVSNDLWGDLRTGGRLRVTHPVNHLVGLGGLGAAAYFTAEWWRLADPILPNADPVEALLSVWLIVTCLVTAALLRIRIALDADGIVVGTPFTVRRVGWSELASFEVADEGFLHRDTIVLVLKDGRRCPAMGLESSPVLSSFLLVRSRLGWRILWLRNACALLQEIADAQARSAQTP